ncbi:MAG TPA: VIT1/CCC1 transporter family protein [Dehalococcoidia bacterium]
MATHSATSSSVDKTASSTCSASLSASYPPAGHPHVLIAAGLAASFTEPISMGAVAYTSFGSVRDFYVAQRGREQEEIEFAPDIER